VLKYLRYLQKKLDEYLVRIMKGKKRMTSNENELTLTRFINAPRTIVWKVWTDPKLLARWWGPKGFTNPVCEIKVHRGGAMRIDMQGPDGTIYPMSGKYLEIVEPKLLVFTSSALDINNKPLFVVFNTITFAKQGDKTKLIMHASVSDITPEAAPHLAGMETGWTQSLVRLEEFIAKEVKNRSTHTNLSAAWSGWSSRLQSVLRVVAAFMFMLAGTVKLFAFPVGMPPHGGTVQLMSQLGLGAILETFGGTLLLLGFFTRPVAFLLAGEMAVAYFQFHAPGGVWPVMNGGVPAVLYCFIWLYFSAAGAGPWSLDAKRGK
jgi:putative oxidoreductase